jgi:replicative DNA helicase
MGSEVRDLLTGRALRRLGEDEAKARALVSGDALPTPAVLAQQQVAAAIARGRMDLSGSPRWGWYELDQLVGKMLPGDLVTVGSITGNGKSTFLASAVLGFEQQELSTLYVPLEIDADEYRRKHAAWRLGFDWELVHGNDWNALPSGAREAHEAALEAQIQNPYLHFAPPKRPTVALIGRWIRWGVEHLAVRIVVIDHITRLDYGLPGAAYRLAVTDGARSLRDLARELNIVIIVAAQLNRIADPVDRYLPATLARVKESAGIAEESRSALMLSRGLRRDVTAEDFREARAGRRSETTLAAGNLMRVTCRKNSLRDTALDQGIDLQIANGRAVDCYRWSTP